MVGDDIELKQSVWNNERLHRFVNLAEICYSRASNVNRLSSKYTNTTNPNPHLFCPQTTRRNLRDFGAFLNIVIAQEAFRMRCLRPFNRIMLPLCG